MSVLYRARQTWQVLTEKPVPTDLEEVQSFLSPEQFAVFQQLHPSEKSHSIAVFRELQHRGIQNHDLLAAALLHDIGKTRFPLHIWERIIIVLAEAWFPSAVKSWGESEPQGWKRPFVVSRYHPGWGAEMARATGASQLTVNLIDRHQESLSSEYGKNTPEIQNLNPTATREDQRIKEDQLLILLQQSDSNN